MRKPKTSSLWIPITRPGSVIIVKKERLKSKATAGSNQNQRLSLLQPSIPFERDQKTGPSSKNHWEFG